MTNATRDPGLVEALTPDDPGLTMRVDDMTCGGCAGAVRRAIENGLAGASADIDLAARTVTVRGAPNADAVRALIEDAGYTPAWG